MNCFSVIMIVVMMAIAIAAFFHDIIAGAPGDPVLAGLMAALVVTGGLSIRGIVRWRRENDG